MDNETRNSQVMEFEIQLRAHNEITADDIDVLTRSLGKELEEIPGAVDVTLASSEEMVPEGSKTGAEAITLGALLLAILPESVPALIDFIKDWTLRPGSTPVKLKVKHGKKSIELEYDPRTTSEAEIARLLDVVKRK